MYYEDSEYVRRAKLGQKDAFGVLVDRHRGLVFSLCFNKCGNAPDAEDLAQEVFIRAYTSLHQLRDESKFAHWVLRIAYMACAGSFRNKHVHLPLQEDLIDTSIPLPIEDELIRLETRHLVSDALEQLPEKHQLATVLHYLFDYTYEEIARVTGMRVNTLREVLRTSRRRLKSYVEQKLSDDVVAPKPDKSLTRRILSGLASFEKDEMFSHMRALKALLEFYGQRVDWNQLLGASGEAFSIYFNPQWTYHASFVHSWDVLNAACAVYGYKGEWHLDGDFDSAMKVVESSLGRGLPVAAPGIKPAADRLGGSESHYWFVVTGIDRVDKRLTLSGVGEQDSIVPYPWRDRNGEITIGWKGIVRCLDVHPQLIARNPLFTVSPQGDCPDEHELAVGSLRRAVRIAREPSVVAAEEDGPVVFHGGSDAIRQWAEALRRTTDVDLRREYTPSQCPQNHYGSVIYTTSTRLEVARRAASAHVHSLATSDHGFGSELVEAANCYETVANTAHRLFELFFDPTEEIEMRKAVSRYPKPAYYTCDEQRKFWDTFFQRFLDDPERRGQGAQLIEEIAEEDEAATRSLERVLAKVA